MAETLAQCPPRARTPSHLPDKEQMLAERKQGDEEEKNLCLKGTVYPDEEEAAFLRSLGWDENAGEEDGLTEEEINAFYEEYIKVKPSLKLCRDVEQKITSLCITPGRAEHILN